MTSQAMDRIGAGRLAQGFGVLDGLAARLDAARRRLLAHRLVHVLALALAGALGLFCLLALGALLLGAPLSLARYVAPAIGAGVALALMGVGYVLARQPSRAVFARTADRVLGTRERLSTAFEVAEGPGPLTPTEEALLLDAAARAESVEPNRLVPFRLPRALFAVLAFGTLAALIAAFASVPQAPVAPAQPSATLAEAERAEFAGSLREIADLVAADADRRGDSYIEAVARDIARIGEAVASGALLDREAISAELERAFGHASDGYRRAGETIGGAGDLSRAVQSAIEALNRPPGEAGAQLPPAFPSLENRPAPALGDEAAGESGAARAPGEGAAGEAGGPAAGPGSDAPASDPSQPMARQDGDAGPLVDTDCGVEGDDTCFGDLELANYNQPVAQPGNQAASGSPNAADQRPIEGGMLIGPSMQSNAGDSTQAGRGSDALDGFAWTSPEGELGDEDMLLEGRPLAGEGQRIRLDVPPELGGQALAEGEMIGAEGWLRLAESEIGRTLLPPALGDIVSRYFRVPVEPAR